jgi:hypothetical protein
MLRKGNGSGSERMRRFDKVTYSHGTVSIGASSITCAAVKAAAAPQDRQVTDFDGWINHLEEHYTLGVNLNQVRLETRNFESSLINRGHQPHITCMLLLSFPGNGNSVVDRFR